MDQKYVLRSNETSFELTSDDALELDEQRLSESKFHIMHEDISYVVEILHADYIKRKYIVKLHGNTFEVDIDRPLDQLISEMGLSLGSGAVTDEIYAPMPGIILEVNVVAGDVVTEGATLCVLEAMKMENALVAPRNGTIKTVTINQGDTVEKGKLLIEFEEDDQ